MAWRESRFGGKAGLEANLCKIRPAFPKLSLAAREMKRMCRLIMREARTNGAAAACKKYGVPYWKARYLEMKSFGAHPNKHGGRRYSTLTPASQLLLEWSAFIFWSEAPRNGDYQVMQMLKEHLGWDWMEGGSDGSARTRVHRIGKNVLKFTDKKHLPSQRQRSLRSTRMQVLSWTARGSSAGFGDGLRDRL
eukprot:g35154.t1